MDSEGDVVTLLEDDGDRHDVVLPRADVEITDVHFFVVHVDVGVSAYETDRQNVEYMRGRIGHTPVALLTV
jgi:hypothetical protein